MHGCMLTWEAAGLHAAEAAPRCLGEGWLRGVGVTERPKAVSALPPGAAGLLQGVATALQWEGSGRCREAVSCDRSVAALHAG